jgi:hypothetical protein
VQTRGSPDGSRADSRAPELSWVAEGISGRLRPRYACKSLRVDRRTYQATISIDILTIPLSP